jgi:hypothetical protein
MFLKSTPRVVLTFLAGAFVLSTAGIASAESRHDRVVRSDSDTPRVVYMTYGQSRVILPDYSNTDREQPYALRGSDRSTDTWSQQSHRIYVGQGSVTLPAWPAER